MIRTALVALAGALATTACMAPEQVEEIPAAPDMVCDASKARQHVGHPISQQMGEAILRDSGARTLRWGGPDTAWTMDYRPDRVGVRYDANRNVTDITCG